MLSVLSLIVVSSSHERFAVYKCKICYYAGSHWHIIGLIHG